MRSLEEGDVVDVYIALDGSVYFENCKVLYIPTALGDCYHLEYNSNLILVNTFAYLIRKP